MSQEFNDCLKKYTPIKKPGSRTAIIFVHGFLNNLTDYAGLCELLIKRSGDGVDFYPFKYLNGKWRDRLSSKHPKNVADLLKKNIEAISEHYDEIILIGHSVGTMLLRQAIVKGIQLGQTWPGKIQRLILISSTNRGYKITKWGDRLLYFVLRRWIWFLLLFAALSVSFMGRFVEVVSSSLYPWLFPIMILLAFLGFAAPHRVWIFKNLFVESILTGADWPIGLRLAWLELDESKISFKIYHILGEKDPLIDRKDNVDFYRFRKTRELILKNVGHHEFKLTPRKNSAKSSDLARIESVRKDIDQAISDCLHDNSTADRRQKWGEMAGVGKYYLSTEAAPESERNAKNRLLVFLVHGIRDFGEWQDSLGGTIRELAQTKGKAAEIVAVRYGYFSAFQFLFPFDRNRVTKSFLDRYCQARNEHPGAKVVIAAHSNGTYVFAKLLRNDELNITAERVYLAGSVLPRNFEWSKLTNQVGTLRNDCAGADWPVGTLCWMLGMVPGSGLGTGGHNGFDELQGQHWGRNNQYLDGDHSAALDTKFHHDIAEFVVTGKNLNSAYSDPSHFSSKVAFWSRFGFSAAVIGVIATFASIPFIGPGVAVMLSSSLFTLLIVRVLMRL